jgi:hypothetical protein
MIGKLDRGVVDHVLALLTQSKHLTRITTSWETRSGLTGPERALAAINWSLGVIARTYPIEHERAREIMALRLARREQRNEPTGPGVA